MYQKNGNLTENSDIYIFKDINHVFDEINE